MTRSRPQLTDAADSATLPPPKQQSLALRDQDLLWSDFLAMALSVVSSVDKSVEALCHGRLDLIPEIKTNERQLDNEEVRIEQECLRILALYEPVASDLRRTATVLKANRDWERISDLAARLARRAGKLARSVPPATIPHDLQSLARSVQARTQLCLNALIQQDSDLARQIIAADREIDLQYRAIRKQLKSLIRENPSRLNLWLQFMNAARNLERIADHSTAIAQMIVYLQEGIFLRHSRNRPKLDTDATSL